MKITRHRFKAQEYKIHLSTNLCKVKTLVYYRISCNVDIWEVI
jgi:hypothetical protein